MARWWRRFWFAFHEARDNSGCIVTLSDGSVHHFPGKSGLRRAYTYAARRDLTVCTVSTPESVLHDLDRRPV